MSESMILTVYILGRDLFSGMLQKFGLALEGQLSLMGMVTAASVGLGAGIAAVGYISQKMAGDFDQALHKISALTDTTSAQMAYYKQQILQLGPSLDMSATDMAKALYFVISAGYKGSAAIEVLKYSAMAATAGMADQAKVADALTSVLNAYGDENLSVGRAMDDLTKTVVNGKVEFGTLATSIGFTAVTAHAAHIRFDEMSAALAALLQTSGEHGARRIQMEFDNLARSMLSVEDVAKRSDKQLKELGISSRLSFMAVDERLAMMGIKFDRLKYASLDFIGRLKYLAQLTGGLNYQYDPVAEAAIQKQYQAIAATKGQAAAQAWLNLQYMEGNARFEKIVGGAAAFIPAQILLTRGGKAYADVLAQMGTNGEATVAAFDKMRESTNQKWKMFELTVQNLAIVLGLQLLPTIGNLWTGLRQLGLGIIAFLQNTQGMEQFKSALLGVSLIIGVVLIPYIYGAVAAAMPFVTVVLALVAAGTWLGNVLRTHPEILKSLQQLWGDLTKLFQDASSAMGGPSGSGGTAAAAKHNVDALKSLGDAVAGALVGIIHFLDYIVTHQWILDGLKVILIAIATVMAVNWVMGFVAAVGGVISMIAALPGLIAETWSATVAFGALDIAMGPLTLLILALTVAVFGLAYAYEYLGAQLQGNLIDFAQWRKDAQTTTIAIDQMTAAQARADLAFHQKRQTNLAKATNQMSQDAKNAHTKQAKDFYQAWANYGKQLQQRNQQQIDADKARLAEIAAQHRREQAAHQAAVDGLGQHHRRIQAATQQHYTKVAQLTKAAQAAEELAARLHYAALHGLAQWFYNLMHPTHAKAHAKHLADTKAHHQQVQAITKAHHQLMLHEVVTHGQQTVSQHAQQLQQGKAVTTMAAQVGITHPVQAQMQVLHESLKDSGKNLVQMIADDITASAPKLGAAAQGAFNQIKGWLGFHSPAPKVPESAYWGSNLIKMIAADMAQAGPMLAQSAMGALQGMAAQFTQPLALGGASGPGLVGNGAPLVGGGAQTVYVTHNWNGAFPGVKSSDDIVAAIRKVQEQDARLGRRPGSGGTRAPTGVL